VVNKALFSSKKHDWNTPENVLKLVRQVAPIGLDPCSNERSTVKATLALDKEQDGLAIPWSGHGLVFVNPPYGREIEPWIEKCRAEAAHGAEIVALVPARTDPIWMQRDGFTAQRICFWRGRIRFQGAAAGAPFPSALLYWGGNGPRFAAVFSDHGRIVRSWPFFGEGSQGPDCPQSGQRVG